MQNRPSILIKKLILIGHRKNYVIPFFRGVNIIYGDSATGKSSILELINYLFGSSKFIYDHEIQSSVIYAALEVELNDQIYVIKRDIFNAHQQVEVFASKFDEINKIFPKKFAPDFDRDPGPDGYLSDFLLNSLNLPILKVPESPSKAESSMVRLSFRDLFKFCYLKQDDVGSKQFLDQGNWAIHSKNKQTFKYIFNLLDSNITGLIQKISDLTSQKKGLEIKYKSVSDFLRETQFESAIGLTDSSEELQRQEAELELHLTEIKKSMIADNETYIFLKETLDQISAKKDLTIHDKNNCELSIDRFSRLKNDYQNDIAKLKAIKIAKQQIGKLKEEMFCCPICNNELTLNSIKDEFQIDVSDKVNHEVNVLLRRMKDLELLLTTERGRHQELSLKLNLLNEEQLRVRRMLDEEPKTMITPYLSERDGIIKELTTIKEKANQLGHSLKIRNQQKAIYDEIDRLHTQIYSLQERLEILKQFTPSTSKVFGDLGDLLSIYLKKINIKDRRDISISERSILPVLRNRDYIDITSGGLRTILSIGYLINLFEYSLKEKINLPSFLMIDTVGKYLGKTQDKYSETDIRADTIENISDPSKYKNMYEYMINVAEKAEKDNSICQFILVDNDVPASIQKQYAGFIVAHYSSNGGNGLSVGLIDDAPQSI